MGILQGCCHSTLRDEGPSSPYAVSNAQGDSSSRAITFVPSQIPEAPSPRNSSQAPTITHRSRNRRHLALGEQFNAPLRPHIWISKRSWTRAELDRERREFFETRVTGHSEIWATLKVVVGLLADGDIATAQSIINAAAITVPTGDLKNGVYDEAGNLYQMPEHVISDPQNTAVDQHREDVKGEVLAVDVDDEDELERKRDEKGKAVLKSEDAVRVKARLSDRGGPDIVISLGKEQAVRVLVRRIREEANVNFLPLIIDCWKLMMRAQITGTGRVKIAYMGKILKEGESLQTQSWKEGHVVNVLVF